VSTNRIDEILNQVGLQIIERRLVGNFPPGYEDLVEQDHDLQLGKIRESELETPERLSAQLLALRDAMDEIVELEPDTSRFRLVRIFRDTARVRHDLRATKQQIKEVHERIEELLKEISIAINVKTLRRDRLATQLSYQVIERTMLLDQVVTLCRDLEKRLAIIEQKS
jgi:septal ring factor EnvC (AmiA/AmiB activator)